MRKDLGLKPYEVQLVQELKPADHSLCRQFANFILGQGDGFYEKKSSSQMKKSLFEWLY